ncbi:MAG: surface-adhesin E family protein [Candidatus Puniceispirillales bacterium]
MEVIGDWKGNTYYLDFDRIRKYDGYVYYWSLTDYLKPNKYGYLSGKIYWQGDCKLVRGKPLTFSHYKDPMGEGTGETNSLQNAGWINHKPNTPSEKSLISVCEKLK